MSSDSLARSHCALLLACVHLLQVTSLTADLDLPSDTAFPFAKDDMSLWIDEAQVKQFFNGIVTHFMSLCLLHVPYFSFIVMYASLSFIFKISKSLIENALYSQAFQ